MRTRLLLALMLLLAAASCIVAPRATADPMSQAMTAAPPSGESQVQDQYADAAPVRLCPDNNLYDQADLNCDPVESQGNPVYVPNGGNVIMRCWIGDGGNFPPSKYPGWSSKKWFYVTVATGNPETEVSGFMYSMVVAYQVPTPECSWPGALDSYPYDPNAGQITIANRPSPNVLTVDFSSMAFGPATIYCHVGSAADYATGGRVTDLGSFDINASNYWDTFTIPVCGTGNQWIGIITSDGIVRYSNQVTIGSSTPPPPPPPTYQLVGTTANYSLSASPGFYVGASVEVAGLTVQNSGNAAVAVDQIALGVTSPSGQRTDYTCNNDSGNSLTNVTITPGQVIRCVAAFSPDATGTWTYDIDWQGTDGQWRADLYVPMTVEIGTVPRPANDDFANAQDVTAASTFSGDNTNATAEPGEPAHVQGGSARRSVWFKFTARTTGRAWVTMDDTNYSAAAVAAYSGSAVGSLTALASWDGTNSDQIAFPVTQGGVYYIAVDDYYSASTGGPFAGSYEIAPTTPPGNDAFGRAQPIRPGIVYDSDLTDATVQAGEPTVVPGDPNIGSVWYSYRPGEDVTLTLTSPGGDATEGVAVYTGSRLSGLRKLGWNILSKGSSPLTVALTGGRTYYIAVANYVGPDPTSGIPQPGQFELLARVKPQPPAVTTVLPTLYTGEHYSIQLHAKDGKAPYTWRLKQSVAQTGVGNFTLSSTGVLSGRSADWGEGWLDILVTDAETPRVVAESWVSETVVLDDTPPSGRITKVSTGPGSAKVSWTAADKQSGYDHAQIRYQQVVTSGKRPGWVTTGALRGTTATIRINAPARYRIEIRFTDKSGNIGAWTAGKTITVPPR